MCRACNEWQDKNQIQDPLGFLAVERMASSKPPQNHWGFYQPQKANNKRCGEQIAMRLSWVVSTVFQVFFVSFPYFSIPIQNDWSRNRCFWRQFAWHLGEAAWLRHECEGRGRVTLSQHVLEQRNYLRYVWFGRIYHLVPYFILDNLDRMVTMDDDDGIQASAESVSWCGLFRGM